MAKDDQDRASYRLRGGDGPQKDVNMREKAAFMEGRKVGCWCGQKACHEGANEALLELCSPLHPCLGMQCLKVPLARQPACFTQ